MGSCFKDVHGRPQRHGEGSRGLQEVREPRSQGRRGVCFLLAHIAPPLPRGSYLMVGPQVCCAGDSQTSAPGINCEGWRPARLCGRPRPRKFRPASWIHNWVSAQVWSTTGSNFSNLQSLNQAEPQINVVVVFFSFPPVSWAPNQGFFKTATPNKPVRTRTKPIHFLKVLNRNNMGILQYLSN